MVFLFCVDLAVIWMYVTFSKHLNVVSGWIDEKRVELLNVDDSKYLINTIKNKSQLFNSWLLQIQKIILPGILITQFITAHTLNLIINEMIPSGILINFVAFAQAGIIISLIMVIQRMRESIKITQEVNAEVIQLTVIKDIDKIEAKGDNEDDGE